MASGGNRKIYQIYLALLGAMAIICSNQVRSEDVTEVHLTKGGLYLVAIISW
jgi:hypothetical protein